MRSRRIQLILASGLFAGAAATTALVAQSATPGSYFGSVIAQQAKVDSAVHLFEPDSLSKAMPSVTYKYLDRRIRVSSLVALGKFSEPRELAPISNSEEPAPIGALPWKRGALTFTVERVVSSGGITAIPSKGDQLDVEFYFDPAVDVLRAEQDLVDTGEAVGFFAGDGTESAPWTIAQNGSLVASVAQQGQLTLPAAHKRSDGRQVVDDLLVDATSVNDLVRAGATPTTVIVR